MIDLEFKWLLDFILTNGEEIETRNSKVKRSTNLIQTFYETPLVSIRKTAWKNALREMEWFMSGSCNINDLHESVRHWWQPWANNRGDILNNYSMQFRNYTDHLFDQIQYLIEGISKHPYSRRNVITTWNTEEMDRPQTPITNCHGTLIQCFVNEGNELEMTMYQRSADMVLGVQHNWIQYWALLLWLAHRTGREVGSLTWIGGDCHIYSEHYEIAREIASNKSSCVTPKLVYEPSSEQFKANDFSLNSTYSPVITRKVKMIV